VPLHAAYKAGLVGHLQAEPLERGHDWKFWVALIPFALNAGLKKGFTSVMGKEKRGV
jgi:hypothetical protein